MNNNSRLLKCFSQALCCLALLFFSHSIFATEQALSERKIMRTAVANEFREGLHSKYLAYLANKIDMEVNIDTMPFARRLQEMRKGNLDILVGLVHTESREDEFYYLQPAYESLAFKIYTLKEHQSNINNYQDLQSKVIGINRHSKFTRQFEQDNNLTKVAANGLVHNIQLLLKGRIDAFIHYGQSTEPLLKQLGMENKIVATHFQFNTNSKHYFVVSKNSWLISYKETIEKAIANGVVSNDFQRIRIEHYSKQ